MKPDKPRNEAMDTIKGIRFKILDYANNHDDKMPELIQVSSKGWETITGSSIHYYNEKPVEICGIPLDENTNLKDDEIILGVKVKL